MMLMLVALTACATCLAFPMLNNEAMATTGDHANAFSGFGQDVVNTGSFSQTISDPGTFADGQSWSRGAAANILGTNVAFETGASSSLAMGIDPFGANVAYATGTHSSSAISNDELGMAQAESNTNSMTMGNGQAFASTGASAIADDNFVVANGQASVGVKVEGSGFPFTPPVMPPVIPPTNPGNDNKCKDGKCDIDFCKGGNCDKWNEPKHDDKDKKCHRHHDKHEKPEKPEVPIVIERVTYYVEYAPVVFEVPEQKIVINEAGECVELYAVNTNLVLNGCAIFQKETGETLLAFTFDDGILVSGDHPVFDWDKQPASGTLVLKNQFGVVLDEFCYTATNDCNKSNQRIPDAGELIEIRPTTWGEPNRY